MISTEGSRQHELKTQLQTSTTASQSLFREIDELKAVHREQLQRLQTTDHSLEQVTQEAEQLYLLVEKDRVGYQRRLDQCVMAKREITQRNKDKSELELEVARRERDLVAEEHRMHQSQESLKSTREHLAAKQVEVSSLENENEQWAKTISDVSALD